MLFQHWGATAGEIDGAVAGDDLVPDARIVATRAIDVEAPPATVFPWLRQMGFGRAGWYSYDWIDNLGRRSADRIHPDWQDVSAGDPIPAGPIDFTAAVVDPPHAFVIRAGGTGRVRFTLAFEIRPRGAGSRLVSRMRGRVDAPLGQMIERFVLGPGDGVMVRRQLLNLAARAGDADRRSP